MISCIALDDEPLAIEIIEEFCKRIPALQLQKTFTDASEAAKHLRKFPVDLLFLDIQMPHLSGVEFCKQYGEGKMVIFTTAFSEYAVEGFNLNAVDYLLKPIEFARFQQAASRAQEYHSYHNKTDKESQHLFVRSEYSLVKIPLSDILYIETLDDYIKIHLQDRKPVLTKMNLRAVSERLSNDFLRVHRSYIVPMSRILSVRGKTIQLHQVEIPIGLKFEEEFFERFKR